MLPPMVELTSMAAAEGAAIVAELQSGKLTVDQARAKIIALNQTVEAMMAETAQMTAATMGRTVNLTTVPLTSQPTVDPVTGKSNMKEMFHKGTTKNLVDKIARSLGVRTSGGGYSTETTLPIVRKNDGGMVYDPSRHGSVVPGPSNINYDMVPAKLPEGSYILNQQASKNNPGLVSLATNKYSGGGKVVDALLTPRETYFDPEFTAANKPLLDKANSGSRIELRNTGGILGGLVTKGIRNYGNIAIDSTDPVTKFIQYYSSTDREDLRIATIAADASTLTSLGLSAEDAIIESSKWFDDRWRETLSLNDGKFSQDIFNQITTDDLPKFEKRLRKQEKYKGKLHRKRLSMPVKNRTMGKASLTRKDWQYVGPTSPYEKVAARNKVLEAMAESSMFEKTKVTRLATVAARFGDGPNNGVQVAHFTPGGSPATPVAGIDHLGRAALQPWEINQIQDSLASYGIFSSDFSLDPAENIAMLDRAAKEHGYSDHNDMLHKLLTKQSTPSTKKTMRTSRGLTTTMQAVLNKKPKEFRGWLANRAMLMAKFAKKNLGGMVGGLVKSGKYGYGNESPAALRLKAFAAAQQVRRDAEHKKNLEKYPWIKPQIDAYRASQKDPLFLGMPRGIKAVEAQRKARLTMEEIDSSLMTSQFANMAPTDFGVLKKASTGHSFPVEGIAGVYQKPDGSIVFVKPVMSETEALAEQRGTVIARGGHGLKSPTQEIRTMIDPTDPAKKRRVIVLESKYDSIFDQANNGVFSQEEYFKQIVAANLRGDRDLSRDNLQGGILNDVGTSGVFKMASSAQGKREYYGQMTDDGVWVDGMPSMKDQARINLLGVKGGAKKFFAESTLDIPKGMTPAQYHKAMIDEIDSVLPNLRKVIASMSLTPKEKQVYDAMIKRLEDGRLVNWEEFHAIHSAVKPSAPKALTPAALLKLKTEAELRMRQRGHSVSLSDNSFKNDANGFNIGGMIQARANGGSVNANHPYLVGEKGPELFVPKNNGGIVSNYALGGMVRSNKRGYGDPFIGPQPYGVKSAFSAGLRGVNTKTGGSVDPTSGMGASMAGMGVMMGGQAVGGTMGSAMTNAGMAMQMYPMLKMIGPHIKSLTTMSGVITKLGVVGPRAFNAIGLAIKFMTGPIGIALLAITAIFAAFKYVNAQNKEFHERQLLTNAITVNGAKEAGIKYNNLSDSIKVVNEQLKATKARGLAAYESLTKIGVIGITYSIKETKAAIKNAKTNKKELVQGFSNIDDSYNTREQQVLDMATNLKIQMVLGGKSVQDATNEIYALISASTNASLAFKTITADSFVIVRDKAAAADEAIKTLNTNIESLGRKGGDIFTGEVLGNALSNVSVAMDSNMKSLVGTKDEFNNVIDQAKAYQMTIDKINNASELQGTLTKNQVETLKETHPQLEEILHQGDTIAGVFAKWQILLSGADVDLKNMSSSEAVAMGEFVAIQQSALDAMEKTGNGILGKSEKVIAKLKLTVGKGLEAAQKAHNKNMTNAQDEIKAIDKKIAKINEEAEARKRALQDKATLEDNALQIQKIQIEYQSALATGDFEAAADAQLRITQLNNQIQATAALQAIEDKRIADVKREEARKIKVQDAAEASAKKLAALQEAASLNQIRLSKIQEYQLRYEQLIKDKMRLQAEPDKAKYEELQKAYIGNVKLLGTNLEADAKGKDKSLSSMIKDIFGGSMISQSGDSLATVTTGLSYNGGISPTPTTNYGAAFGNIDAAAKETEKTIKGLGGGKTLFDLYNAILDGHRSARTAIAAKGTYYTAKGDNGDLGVLYGDSKKQIVADNAIVPGEYFHFNGWMYRVDANGNVIRGNRVPGSRITTGDEFGRVTVKASGGHIKGPGTGTSDSIPALLSNGEYVIKASSVSKYGVDHFDALNAQRFNMGSIGGVSATPKPRPAKTNAQKGEIWGWERQWQEANKQVVKIKIPPITANFATNSFTLNKEQRLELQAIAKDLIAAQVKAIIVQGHTDSVGKGKDNQILSQNRANAIAEYISKFVPGTGFVPVGYGEYKPLVPNTSAENRARNRRAELILPDKYKTIYPEFQPQKHKWVISQGRIEGGGSIQGGGMLIGPTAKASPRPVKTEAPRQMISGFANGGLVGYHLGGLAEKGHKHLSAGHMASNYKAPKSLMQKAWDNFVFPIALSADRLQSFFMGVNPIASTNLKELAYLDAKAKKEGMMSIVPHIAGQSLMDMSLLFGASAPVGNALARTAIEGFGLTKGIPSLGQLLPKGSLPFLGKTASTAVTNLGVAGAIGLSKPFVEGKLTSVLSALDRPVGTAQQTAKPGEIDEIQNQITKSITPGEASRMAFQNQINLAKNIAQEEGRFAPKLIGKGNVSTLDNPRYLFTENLDGNIDDILNWPWSPAIKTDAADKFANQNPRFWEFLHTPTEIEKLSYKQKKVIAMLAGIKVAIGKPFPKITQTQMDLGRNAFYENKDLLKKWGDWSTYRDAQLKSVGLGSPAREKSEFVSYDQAAALKASLEDVRLKNPDGTDTGAYKYIIGKPESNPRWSTAFGSKTSVIGGGSGDRGALMLDGDFGAALRRQYSLVYEDLIKTGFIRRARIDKNGKRIENKALAPFPYSPTADKHMGTSMTLDEFLLHVSSQLPGVTTSSRLMTGTADELASRPSLFIQALNESYVRSVLGKSVEQKFRFTKYDIFGSKLVDKFGNPKAGGYYSLDEGFDYATNPGSRSYGQAIDPSQSWKNEKLTKGKFTIDLLPREFPSPVFAGGGFTDEMAVIIPEWLALAKSKHVAKFDESHFTKPMSAEYGRYLHASRFFKPTKGWTVDDATAAVGGVFGIKKEQFAILADLLNSGKVKTNVLNNDQHGASQFSNSVRPWTEEDLWKIISGYNKNAIIKEGNTRRISQDWLQSMSGNDYSSLDQLLKVEELVNLMRTHIQKLPPISMLAPMGTAKPSLTVTIPKPKMANGGYVNPSYSANMSVPKFENGINMVPADMLAMLHKNEAVVPANMNPFNPNANAYDIKSGSEYNINVTLNGSNLSPDDVAKAISREMQLRDAMQGRSRNR
jgi:outer membrane protein OmpA-like peptidoglycan-associated protein